MTVPPQGADGRPRHVAALAGGAVAIAVVALAPDGVAGSALAIVIAVAALLLAVVSSRCPGPLRALAVAGSLLAGLAAIVEASFILVSMARLPF